MPIPARHSTDLDKVIAGRPAITAIADCSTHDRVSVCACCDDDISTKFIRFAQMNETRLRTATSLLSRAMTFQRMRCFFGCVVCACPPSNTTRRMWALAKVLHTTCRPLSRTNSVLSCGLVCSIPVAVKAVSHKSACPQRRA